jgi:OOP family OmpA-OmpF porin
MKKTILLSAILAGTLALATDYNYEVTPVVGYNYAQNKTGLDNNEIYGAEIQYNGLDTLLKPELSFIYSPDVNFDLAALSARSGVNYTSAKSDLFRTAINGVYEYNKFGAVIPLAKAGLGYENMAETFAGENRNGVFADVGLGAKIPFAEQVALKLEAIYMLKDNDNSWDSNLELLAGLNIAFGAKSQPVVAPTPAPVVVVPAPAPVVAPVPVDGDDDNDGVKNSVDKCPNTPAGAEVTIEGCPVIVNLHINFDFNSYVVKANSYAQIEKFAKFLKMNPNYTAKIVGHTDDVGSDKFNLNLSLKRATAVKDLLVKAGVETNRIASYGKGETTPVATNNTKEGRAENRRIEAELFKK